MLFENPLLENPLVELAAVTDLAEAGRLYAVLDCCQAPHVYQYIQQRRGEKRCLLGNKNEVGLWAHSPWLVPADTDLVTWVRSNLWQEPWGIFLASEQPFAVVFKQLFSSGVVRSTEGRKMYFRYWDPRVLPAFLHAADIHELKWFLADHIGVAVGYAKWDLRLYQPVDLVRNAKGTAKRLFGSFTIRQRHHDAFHMADDALFLETVILHVRESHEETSLLSSETLADMVEEGIEKAREEGFTTVADILTFVDFQFAFAPNFHEHPRVRRILDDPSIHQEHKLDEVLDLPRGVFAEIDERYDNDAWFPDAALVRE
ncbi:DUF4123 domain-containing protein [Sulfidibacter corallicola]|uniref:DUF4123 domain-containing protein n=1 Tax=Sulfidibacter corallicola TaxID=2818388 RepID=A0A8A4TFF6_SULCO|nr:DUF4123 domain-containing protein [Sulfidibacter corallicola]QTD48363.1 DUF4123 domain-containing protein [Sulfidibacter corallicola]